jgi:septum site-determining protein MinC
MRVHRYNRARVEAFTWIAHVLMNRASAAQEAPCEIRLGQVGLAQLRLRSLNPDLVHAELAARAAAAPQLFDRTAVCLDLSTLDAAPAASELSTLLAAIRRAGFFPVGVLHGVFADALAPELDLPLIAQWRAAPKPALGALLKEISPPGRSAPPRPPEPPVVEPAPAPAPPAPADPGSMALLHHQPVRSGQRVYARNRDLIVTTAVGAGAEVMADGCVHIYGVLRGRALAGARGDASARVFCQEFSAELVSIAGVFRVFETIPRELAGKPVQAWLEGDALHFSRIGA